MLTMCREHNSRCAAMIGSSQTACIVIACWHQQTCSRAQNPADIAVACVLWSDEAVQRRCLTLTANGQTVTTADDEALQDWHQHKIRDIVLLQTSYVCTVRCSLNDVWCPPPPPPPPAWPALDVEKSSNDACAHDCYSS